MSSSNKNNLTVFMQEYLEAVKSDNRKVSIDNEINAYELIMLCIAKEENPLIKELMQRELEYYCNGYTTGKHGMLLSYIQEQYWDSSINSYRETLATREYIISRIEKEPTPKIKKFMQGKLHYFFSKYPSTEYIDNIKNIDKKSFNKMVATERELQSRLMPFDLFINLERILSSNSKSSKYTTQEDFNPRYPINIDLVSGEKSKVKNTPLSNSILASEFLDSHYSFGSHDFYAGLALLEIIEFLKTRYNLNFEELEKQFQQVSKNR